MANGFPLLTTKKMFVKAIFEELIFFLRGETNTKMLEDRKVMIWHENTTNDFIKSNGKRLTEFDMGPMYGFQWRHYGAEYTGCDHEYENKGIDQLKTRRGDNCQGSFFTTYFDDNIQSDSGRRRRALAMSWSEWCSFMSSQTHPTSQKTESVCRCISDRQIVYSVYRLILHPILLCCTSLSNG